MILIIMFVLDVDIVNPAKPMDFAFYTRDVLRYIGGGDTRDDITIPAEIVLSLQDWLSLHKMENFVILIRRYGSNLCISLGGNFNFR